METHGGCVTAGNSTSAFDEDELEVEGNGVFKNKKKTKRILLH
jgi:hypothetical protein